MPRVTTLRIEDLEGGGLSFDLRDLLDVLGDEGIAATWDCQVGDFVPAPDAVDLPAAYDAATNVHGSLLYQLASRTLQIIDGRFVAIRPGTPEPWVTLEAVDSSFWEVTTNDEAVIGKIFVRFRAVERIASEKA